MSAPVDKQLLDELRPVAFAIAYRMLGSVAEAEDVVQEALLRLHRRLQDGERIESPRAFLATVTTRLAIDSLRSARVRRERYVGDWLPEPIVTDSVDDPARRAEVAAACRRAVSRSPAASASGNSSGQWNARASLARSTAFPTSR